MPDTRAGCLLRVVFLFVQQSKDGTHVGTARLNKQGGREEQAIINAERRRLEGGDQPQCIST